MPAAQARWETWSNVEASPKKGLIALSDMSHFTINASDATSNPDFLSGSLRRAGAVASGADAGDGHRSRRHVPDVHRRRWRTRWTRGRGAAPGAPAARSSGTAAGVPRASVNHVSMNMENFKPDEVMKTLASFGISKQARQRRLVR